MSADDKNSPDQMTLFPGVVIVFHAVWRGRLLIGIVTLITTLVAVAIALFSADVFRAEALLVPNEDDTGDGIAGLLGQYGGLAGLAGVSLPSDGTEKKTLGIEILRSREFITSFIERHDILVELMASKGWDSDTNSLILDDSDYDAAKSEWIRKVRPPRKIKPSLQEAHEEFEDIYSIREDASSGYVRVSIEHHSPIIAKQWVDWIVEDLNKTVMERDVVEAEQAIAYLTKQIQATSLAEMREVFFRLIEEQYKIIMLAKMTTGYVFKTVDPAVAPEMKERPKRVLIIALGVLSGILLGLLILFGTWVWRGA